MKYVLAVLSLWGAAVMYAMLFGKDEKPEDKPQEPQDGPCMCYCCGKREVEAPGYACLPCCWPY